MDGQNIINEIAFSQPVINIGADGGNDIILRGQGISDFHLMLNYASNVWHLVPLDPSSSTLVNGRGIGPEGCSVQSGAVISVGDYRLTLSLNGIYADIMVAQIASSVPYQSNVKNTEEPEGNSILLSLSDKLVPAEIEAGTAVEYELTVTNAGPLVANMQLQVQGIPSAWVQIIPPVLNLNEGRSGNFIVRVTPPHTSAAKAGLYQLHFVATSPNYPRETGVADAMLTILPYSDFLVNGPTPRRLNLSRSHSSDFTDLIIINNSNAASTFTVRSYDDANELNFAYKQNSGNLVQGQITMTVNPGDNDRLPIQVETRKRPLIGLSNHFHHYYTTVTPMDRPGDAQSLLGEVTVRPMIHVIWLLITLLLLAGAALIFLQPYIHQFDSVAGKRTEVIMAGNSVGMNWDVSRFASKVTLNDGTEERQVTRQGNEFVSPSVSTTYTIKAENFLSNLIGMKYEKEFRVLLIPRRPTIDVFNTDTVRTNYSKPVRLSWGVSPNASTASIVTNKQEQVLAAENYSGNQSNTYLTDTLISLKAVNASGYEEKSVFVNVKPDKITLKRFIAWVRPNGIAVPSDNDIRRTTRWGSLQLYAAATPAPQTIRPAVNPQPDAQSNAILIPDNYGSGGTAQGGINPEQQSVNRILSSTGADGLLVGPYIDAFPTSTPVPTANAAPTAAVAVRSPNVSSSAASNSPESNAANREFSIKLVEIVEDPISESGYRVISYFPDYVLQKGEQIRIEWEIEGLNQITIENLSGGNLTSQGADFAYPEKSTNYVLNAEIGDLKKTYSLPVNVAGEADDGEGSGLNCNLKANPTTLAIPGTVMLTWTGGGNNRVQLLSSVQAEKENAEAEKKKEAEAKEKGQPYTQPTNAPLSGGTIGDNLQPSGFMRVNVDKQTTFVLNAYDGNGNVICSKEVEIKYTGGNDKLDLKLAITKISDTNDVSQPYYTVGQTVQFTVALTDFKKGVDPTGSILLTDGDSTCTMTLPKNTCSMVMKHAGVRPITAVYGGDDAYNKTSATASLTVRAKINTMTEIASALKAASDLADLVARLTYSSDLAEQYGKTPTGKITFTMGSGTCDLEISTMKLSCGGTGVKSGDIYTLKNMIMSDQTAKTVKAKYNGDDYFNPSESDPVNFATVPTTLVIENAYRHSAADIDLTTRLSWDPAKAGERTPGGTITYTSGTAVCTLDLATLKFSECSGKATIGGDGIYHISGMAMKGIPGDYIYAEYKGDSFFDGAVSQSVKFKSVPTDLALSDGKKNTGGLIDLNATLSWADSVPVGTKPKGTIKFVNDTTGNAFCTLDISGNTPKFTDGCTGHVKMSLSAQNVTFNITEMNSGGKAGDKIKAVYSGDDYFLTSESKVIDFNKTDTALAIIDALKNGADCADIRALLSWDPNEAGGAEPTGTVRFTAGSGSCTLDIETEEMDCEPKIGTADPDDPTAPKEITLGVVKMLLADKKADRVKVEYSGDAVFNPSSSTTALFRTVPTTVTIGTAVKPDVSHANVLQLRLKWNLSDVRTMVNKDVDPSIDRKPTGTITLTVGSGSCLLDAATGKLSGCSGTSGAPALVTDGSDAYYSYAINMMALSDKAAAAIKASYSGDGFFEPSASDMIDFSKIPTEIMITKADKSNSDRANVSTDLTWDPNGTQGLKPTGTIKFTIRNGSNGAGDVVTGTCILDLSTKKLNCDSEAPSIVTADGSVTSAILNMLLADKNADRIKAEYSGDTLFKASESTIVLFSTRDKIDTILELNDAYKLNSGLASVYAMLSWPVKDEHGDPINQGILPTGTITFTIGGDSCKLTFDDASAGSVKSFSCSEKDVTKITPSKAPSDPDDVITWKLLDILLSAGNTADRIKAEYSGDANFNPSSSEFIMFGTMPTDITLSGVNRNSSTGLVDLTSNLYWYEIPPEDEQSATIHTKTPTGTIKLTSGSASCTILIDPLSPRVTDCPGELYFQEVDANTDENRPKKMIYKIRDLKIGDGTGNDIKAEYSGDGLFLASVSPAVAFDLYETETIISDARSETDGSVDVFVYLKWDQSETGTNDPLTADNEALRPTGTIKFTAGSGTCTLQINHRKDPKFIDCDVQQASLAYVKPRGDNYWYTEFQIYGLKIGDGKATSIKAEYSGDPSFRSSVSDMMFFTQVDTEIEINKDTTYKPEVTRVNLEATLTWCYYGCGKEDRTIRFTPTGPVTFTIGSDSCKLDLTNGSFSCADYLTKVEIFDRFGRPDTEEHQGEGNKWYKDWKLKITNILLSNGNNADRVKADFAGDKVFNPSSSNYVLFPTLPTETKITNQEKLPSGLVNAVVDLSWNGTPPQSGMKPGGTIKLTSGSAVCTLDISADPVKFTDCEGSVTIQDGKYSVRNLKFGSGAGEDLKAEYSGSGCFLASASEKVYFYKIDTELVITSAYKPNDPSYANFVSILSWDKEKAATRKPTGTIKYTVGSGSCVMDLSTEKLSCDSDTVTLNEIAPDGENKLQYVTNVLRMLLSDASADRIKAEYSGDAVFNPSGSTAVLFKTVNTEIRIANAYKNDEKHATVRALLDWVESEADGRKPTGTVKFVIGSGSCTLTIETGKLSCEPGTGTVEADRKSYSASKMLLDDSTADRVSAEYSGDGFFKPSVSPKVLFDRIDTNISLKNAYRYKAGEDGFVWLDSLLDWDEEESMGKTPTGTIKMRINGRIGEYDLTAKTLKIDGTAVNDPDGKVEADDALRKFVFKNIPLNAEYATSPTIEYSGDLYFGPSSAPIEFGKIPTATEIKSEFIGTPSTVAGNTLDVRTKTSVNIRSLRTILNEIPLSGYVGITVKYTISTHKGEGTPISDETVEKSCLLPLGGNGSLRCDDNAAGSNFYAQLSPGTDGDSYPYQIEALLYHNIHDTYSSVIVDTTVEYEGDILYAVSSSGAYAIKSNGSTYYYDSKIEDEEAVQLADGSKYIKFSIKDTADHWWAPYSIYGNVIFTTSNGKRCSVEIEKGVVGPVIKENDCGGSVELRERIGSLELNMKNLTFDPDKADYIHIQYMGDKGNGHYHGSSKRIEPFDETPTYIFIEDPHIYDSGEVDMTVNMPYTLKELTGTWPAGSLKISKGSYTCTIPLQYGKNNPYSLDLGSVSQDCGGGSAEIRSQSDPGLEQLIITINNLPVTDHNSPTIKVSYSGDWSNLPSEKEETFANRLDLIMTSSVPVNADQFRVDTTISTADSSPIGRTTGEMTYTFKPSGNTCTATITENTAAFSECPSGAFYYDSTGNGEFHVEFRNVSPSDTELQIRYSGNDKYFSVEETVDITPYEVILTPVTSNLYTNARLYFNTADSSRLFPKYPENDYIEVCEIAPGLCRTLLREFPLTVNILVKGLHGPANGLLTDPQLFYLDGSINKIYCPAQFDHESEDGLVFTCHTGEVSFTTTGIKKITAHFEGTGRLSAAEADFPEMVAVEVHDNANLTRTTFSKPASGEISVGETVSVEAYTIYNSTSIGASSDAYVYYTYTGYNEGNHRIAYSPAGSDTLTITADTKQLVAEFLGNADYLPSTGHKSVSPATVTLGLSIGGG